MTKEQAEELTTAIENMITAIMVQSYNITHGVENDSDVAFRQKCREELIGLLKTTQ